MEAIRKLQAGFNYALWRLKWEAGQTTAEYALVLLAAAAIAVVLIQWASEDGNLSEFFTAVINQIKENAGIGGGGN